MEEFAAPRGTQFRLGADFGSGGPDPTVLVRCFIEGKKLYVDHEAYQLECEIDEMSELFLTVPEAEKWPIVGDSARPDLITHLVKKGFHITGAIKGRGSVEAGVQWLQNYELIVHPRCQHTIDELSHYSRQIDKLTGEVLPALEDENNHVIDALRFSCENVRRLYKEVAPSNVIPIMSRWNRAA